MSSTCIHRLSLSPQQPHVGAAVIRSVSWAEEEPETQGREVAGSPGTRVFDTVNYVLGTELRRAFFF